MYAVKVTDACILHSALKVIQGAAVPICETVTEKEKKKECSEIDTRQKLANNPTTERRNRCINLIREVMNLT